MKFKLTGLSFAVILALSAIVNTGCKTPSLEVGGPYAPADTNGVVIYSDVGLALADTTYQFAYETILSVMKFERDNRLAIWEISPNVKRTLDKARPQVVDIDKRWVTARRAYKLNPTPAGLSTLQTILAEIQRLVPVIESQLVKVNETLTKKQ